jgi:hypothetical protein
VVTTILPPAPRLIGGIFQTVPPEVTAAWEAHRPWASINRRLTRGEAEPYVASLITLQRAVRHYGRKPGYFSIDGHLVGFCSESPSPTWTLVPDRCPIRQEGRP